jgi:hypothetical protein
MRRDCERCSRTQDYPQCNTDVHGRPSLRFHWAIFVGPKLEKTEEVPGRRYAVVPLDKSDPAKPGGWRYEESDLANIKNGPDLLARILIGKIEDERRLHQIVRETPVVKDGDAWGCRTWLAEVLARLARDDNDAVGTSVLDWQRIEALTQKYVAGKTENGRYAKPELKVHPAPTWSMLLGRELYP